MIVKRALKSIPRSARTPMTAVDGSRHDARTPPRCCCCCSSSCVWHSFLYRESCFHGQELSPLLVRERARECTHTCSFCPHTPHTGFILSTGTASVLKFPRALTLSPSRSDRIPRSTNDGAGPPHHPTLGGERRVRRAASRRPRGVVEVQRLRDCPTPCPSTDCVVVFTLFHYCTVFSTLPSFCVELGR
jgi:hypothetical protein